jgi:ATP-dependent protease ClpP protease subunit
MRRVILFASMVVWLGAQAQAADPCTEKGELEYAGVVDGAIQLKWTGQIANKMDVKLLGSFAEHQDEAREIVLNLNSCGGYVPDMRDAIKVLDLIKMTHKVHTRVGHGKECGSACVFVFLSGKRRYGALTSVWLFHEAWGEVAVAGESIERRTSSAQTGRLLDHYFVPAGVSRKWMARLRRLIKDGDYWQTGRDLWESKSGIITEPIENLRRRGKQRMYFMPPVVCGDFCRG